MSIEIPPEDPAATPNTPEFTKEVHELGEFNARVIKGQRDRAGHDRAVAAKTDTAAMESMACKASLWAVAGDAYLPCEEAVNELPAGHYVVEYSQTQGVFLRKQEFSIDDLLELPDSAAEQVIGEIEHFWSLESHFRDFGFLWKRGMLLWGPPGSGKTSTVQILAKKIIERGGIAVSIYAPGLAIVGMRIIRKIEPSRPVLGLLEDIDAIVQTHGESDLLALLDGENQVDNIVYLATTNYPERLDPRFINRPSRFDVIKKIGMPSPEARATYILAKSRRLMNNIVELIRWTKDTEGLSIAHMKELIISVEVFNADYDQSLIRLKTMMECNQDSKDDRQRELGFKQAGAEEENVADAAKSALKRWLASKD